MTANSEFSRPSRAGLIEAGRRNEPGCQPYDRFPALHGRASLKPLLEPAPGDGEWLFSRPSRAGLIEAPKFTLLLSDQMGFPALHGRASLKRR